MGIPLDRDITVGTDTPVPPGLLNNLQDAVISAKHGELSFLIHPASFRAIGTDYYGSFPGEGYVKPIGAGGPFNPSAPLPFFPGTKIVSIDSYYERDGAGSVQPMLMRVDLATGTHVNVGNGVLDNSSSGVAVYHHALNHTMVAGAAYHLLLQLTHEDNKIYGALVTIQRL